MATTSTNPEIEATSDRAWPRDAASHSPAQNAGQSAGQNLDQPFSTSANSPRDALQALLAFSALHEQVRRRRALASKHRVFDQGSAAAEFEAAEFFVLDEVLQLVAERAVAITGADGVAIALAENDEIVLREPAPCGPISAPASTAIPPSPEPASAALKSSPATIRKSIRA